MAPLPAELERDIFELLATEYQRRGAYHTLATLLLVAHRVRAWIEPILYGIAIHSAFRAGAHCSPGRMPPIHSIRSKTPPDNNVALVGANVNGWGQHTKHVLLQDPDVQTITTILEACPRLENVVLWTSEEEVCQAAHRLLGAIPLRRLCIDLYSLVWYGEDTVEGFLERNPNPFSNLTHLTLQDRVDNDSDSVVDRLDPSDLFGVLHRHCPRLTHLAFRDASVVQQALDALPNLKILLVVPSYIDLIYMSPGDIVHLDEVKDRRLVIMFLEQTYAELIWDWEKGATGAGDDIWARAERVVENGEKIELQLSRARQDAEISQSVPLYMDAPDSDTTDSVPEDED